MNHSIHICILSTFIPFCLAGSPLVRTQLDPVTHVDSLKIITYNVNYGLCDLEVLQNLPQADIIFLQETTECWERLCASLKLYPHQYFHHDAGAGGLAFLSKYPLVVKVLENRVGWFDGLYSQLRIDSVHVDLMNVHLKPGLNERGKVGFLAHEYFSVGNTNRNELQNFLGQIDSAQKIIMGGDFNEGSFSKTLRKLKKNHGYINTCRFSKKLQHTWRWGIFKAHFDHILLKNLSSARTQILHLGRSDHLPVYTTVYLN